MKIGKDKKFRQGHVRIRVGRDNKMKKLMPPKNPKRIIKTLVEIPTFQNIKDDVRMKEEERLMNLVRKHVKQDSSVVDLGCGTSYYTGFNAIGIDLDKEMLKRADLEHKILANYSYCPFKDESFDAVVMCHSLEHTNLPGKPLKEANRILKKGGIIGVSVPNLRGLHAVWTLLWRGWLKGVGPDHPDHLTAFTPQLLKRVFEESCFMSTEENGDIVYFPGMKRLKSMKLGYWLATHFPKWANVYIMIGRKTYERR